MLQSLDKLPGFRSPDKETRDKASSKWWGMFASFQRLLRIGAAGLPEDIQEKYIISVTHEVQHEKLYTLLLISSQEVFNGILHNKDRAQQSVCIERQIAGVEDVSEKVMGKYIDTIWAGNEVCNFMSVS